MRFDPSKRSVVATLLASVAFASFIFATNVAHAQAWPDKPVKLMHGFAAGGNADGVARILANELGKPLGQQMIVEPKPGAGGVIAGDLVAKSRPDGYTLLLATGGHAISAAMRNSLPYDPSKSFQPVSAVTSFPFLLVVNSSSRFQTLQDVLAAAKAKQGGINYGSAGIGTGQHMTGALLAHMAGVPLTHVAYKGESAALTAVLGGEIDVVIAAPTAVVSHVKAGKLRAIATSGATRWPGLPAVPTVAEQGVRDYEVRSWTALLAPAGTPRPIVDKLNKDVRAVLADAAVRGKIEEVTGGDVKASTPEELQAALDADLKRWAALVRDAQIAKE